MHVIWSQVSKAEFIMFMLTELELVGQTELQNILKMFNSLDSDGSGVLTVDDIRARLQEAESQAARDGDA